MPAWRVALIVAGAVLLFPLLVGGPSAMLYALPVVLVLAGVWGAFTYHDAVEERAFYREYESAAPPLEPGPDLPSPDVSEELLDLVKSARQHAMRLVEDEGAPFPAFLMFDDDRGNLRVRRVGTEGQAALAKARSMAQALERDVERAVIAYPGTATDERGKVRPAILLEAAERQSRNRTVSFAQTFVRKRLLSPAHPVGKQRFMGTVGVPLLVGERLTSWRATGADPWAG